jgi:general secretion pathway protein E
MPDPSAELKSLHDMLRNCLLFSEADDATLDFVAQNLKPMPFKKGDPIILEGEIGEDVFFIHSGSVEIVKYRTEIQQVNRITILKPGTHFSEFSVLNRANKSASAFALEDSIIYRLSGETFLRITAQVPAISHRLVVTLCELVINSSANSSLEYFDPTTVSFQPEIPQLLPMPLWREFGVLPLHYYPGILLVALKDPRRKGFYEHCQKHLSKLQINVVVIGEHDFDVTFKRMQRTYMEPLAKPEVTMPISAQPLDIISCLKQSPYFQDVDDNGLQQLVPWFETRNVKAGEVIFKPGDKPDDFFIVQSGQVDLSRPTADQHFWTRLRMRNPGDGLSEVSLVLGKPHSHLARAMVDGRILAMKKTTFDQLLGSGTFCVNLSKILALRLLSYTEGSSIKFNDGEKPPQLNELSKLIPKQLMLQHQLMPIRLRDREITIAIVNPDNDSIYSVISRYLRGYRINFELISLDTFKAWLSQVEAVIGRAPAPPQKAAENTVLLELNKLLIDGMESRASDLHFEPTGTGYCVRYRVDGVLSEIASKISTEVGAGIVNRIKILSSLDIANHNTPQDGQLKVKQGDTEITARVATTPTKQGEGAVLRLIRSRNSAVPLSMLVPDSRTIKTLKNIAHCKQGLFLVTGPTGSGKTTTLYSMIGEINCVDVKIITLEDPVELEIPGVSQIEINEKTGLTFERALKSTLRQDPDVLIVGEIRDAESAKSVFEAALSGHLVISTLHTTNAFAVKNRLKELGVPPGTMAAGLIGSAAQRLVRAICKKCRVRRPITGIEQKMIVSRLRLERAPIHLHEGKGCIICNQTGYHGRLPIMEVWQKNPAIEEVILKNGTVESMLEAARPDGFDTLYEFGLRMALNGLTTIEEVERTMAGGF